MKKKGFTLIELLVVVAIIGILAAVGVVAYNGYTTSAKKNATKSNLNSVYKYLSGEMTLKDTEKFITLKTRQYAKKQRTWFRNQLKDWETIAYGENNSFKDLADRITSSLNL